MTFLWQYYDGPYESWKMHQERFDDNSMIQYGHLITAMQTWIHWNKWNWKGASLLRFKKKTKLVLVDFLTCKESE